MVMFAETHSGCQIVSAEGFNLQFLCTVDFVSTVLKLCQAIHRCASISYGNGKYACSLEAFLILLLLNLIAAFKSREDHRKQLELEEAQKVGLAPAEVDEDGKEINQHIPQYMSSAPRYLNSDKPVNSLLCFIPCIHYLVSDMCLKSGLTNIMLVSEFETSKEMEVRS